MLNQTLILTHAEPTCREIFHGNNFLFFIPGNPIYENRFLIHFTLFKAVLRQLQIQSRRRIWDVSKDKDVHIQLPKHQQNCQVWGAYNVKRQWAYYLDRVYSSLAKYFVKILNFRL